MSTEYGNRRGTRHLRVGVELQPRRVRVTSIWLVDQPAVQADRLIEPVLVRVDLAGQPVLVQAFADPRVVRGTFREGAGHSYLVEDSGVVEVSVPFTDLRQLTDLRVRVADATRARLATTDSDQIARLFDNPPDGMRLVGEVDWETLRNHPDWSTIGATLGLPPNPGRFEVYLDRAGQYRWRLRRIDGEIVADSGQGYTSRESCEADLRWIRSHAASTPVVALDLTGGTAAP